MTASSSAQSGTASSPRSSTHDESLAVALGRANVRFVDIHAALAQAPGQLEQLAVAGAVQAQHGPVAKVAQGQCAQVAARFACDEVLGRGALLGREIDGGRERTLGTLLGAAGGALLGKEIDSGRKCR